MTETEKSWLPTRKWLATQVTAISAWLVAAIQNDWIINTELQIVAVGVVAQAVIGYLLPNDNTPAGIPRRKTRRRR